MKRKTASKTKQMLEAEPAPAKPAPPAPTDLATQIRRLLAPGMALVGKRARSLKTGHVGNIVRVTVDTEDGDPRALFELHCGTSGLELLTLADLEFIGLELPPE